MINLYFTEYEMKNFLIKEGYKIKNVKVWQSYNTYHNQVEDREFDVEIAFVDDLNEFNNSNGSYRYSSVEKYKLKNVFTNVLKSKLLTL